MLFRVTLVHTMTFRSSLFATLACLTLATPATAEVFTWKDANGRVHYSDQPPASVEVKPAKPAAGPKYVPAVADPVATQSGPRAQSEPKADSKPLAAQSGPKTWQEKDLEVKQRRVAEQEGEAKRRAEAEKADEKKRYCDGLRNNLAVLERGGRVTTATAGGERAFLTDTQLKQEAERVRGQLSRDCK